MKKLFSLLFVGATLFMGVGYAAINSISLDISGEVITQAQDGVFITTVDILNSESVGADLTNTKVNNAYQSVLNSAVVLSDLNCDSNVMMQITIYNSTSDIYVFDGVSYDTEFYSNNNITYEVIGFDVGEELIPGDFKTFKLNFYYSSDNCLSLNNGNVLESYLNFDFSLKYFRWDSYEYTGFDLISISEFSSDNVKMRISPKNGAYDRLVIPIDNLEIGNYYVITFTENKELISGSTYINDSDVYTYGTTVTTKAVDESIGTNMESFILPEYFNYDNSPLHTSFMWKEPFLEVDYVEGRTYNISLTFYAAEETMYWLWDFANIENNSEIDFSLSNIKLRKIEYPDSKAYVRFVDTTFNDWKYDIDYNDDGADDEQNYLKYSYRTNASESELDLHIETGVGWEYFNVPIKKLDVGKNYKLSFEVNTTPTILTINTTNIYGALVQDQPFTTSTNIISSTDSERKDVSIINKTGYYSGTIEFTATTETMYWVWQCGGINNYQWANIKISNVVLEVLD